MDSTPPIAINTAAGEDTSKSTNLEGFRQNSPSISANVPAMDTQFPSQSTEETNPFRQLQAHRTGQSTGSQSHSVASGIMCFLPIL